MYEVVPLKYDEIKYLLVPEVATHFRTMGLGEIDFAILRREIAEYLEEQNSIVLVLKKDNEIVGSLAASTNIYLNGQYHAEQKFIYIQKEHRGAYLKIMKAFEKWAENSGANILSASVLLRENARSQTELLQKRGYEPLDIYYTKKIGEINHGR